MNDKVWESRELSMWVNNDESLYRLARSSWNVEQLLKRLECNGIIEISGIKLTSENLKESWVDANG
jgi:hypothetical protein|tara:strand:- start:89 stop:286 length:198 start_codon:yes stop_codon:yes gene_type:complete